MVRGAFYTDLWGTWMPSETFDASLERHRVRCLLSWVKPPMPLSSATDSVACSLEYTDTQGSRLCLSRASQGPLLALWGTVVRRETVYADLSEVHRCSGKPSMPVSRPFNPDLWGTCMDPQGNLLCRSPRYIDAQGSLLYAGHSSV